MLIRIMLLLLLAGFIYIVIKRRLVKYTVKRLLASVLTLFIIVAVVFVLLRKMPIEGYFDNFDKLNESQVNAKLKQLGLTQPLYKQFWDFLVRLFPSLPQRFYILFRLALLFLYQFPLFLPVCLSVVFFLYPAGSSSRRIEIIRVQTGTAQFFFKESTL